MSILRLLDNIDKTLFVLIHHDSDQLILDPIMLALRNPYTWVPLYLFILYYIIKKTGSKAWRFVLMSLTTFAITDSLSSRVFKPLFERPRPCFDPELQVFVRNLVDCGGLYSLPSSHASNHFGLAAFWYWSVFSLTGKKWKWLWLWAASVCYAQVYVGKHYPLDVLAGAVFGYSIGAIMARVFELWWQASKKNLYTIQPS